MMRTVIATRYVTPLREGGSLPAIVEAEDSGLYVLKFRGAGQGPKALIAELIAGELARAVGLRVPELVFIHLDPVLGRAEPDGEIRDLIKASAGLNLAMDYLPRSITFDPVAGPAPGTAEASSIVCFDAYVTNVDRTPKNPNMLVWHRALWLIDHGAALYFHHSWEGYLERARSAFAPIKDHVLLPWASELRAAEALLRERLTPEVLEGVVGLIPEEWLEAEAGFPSKAEHRAAYVAFLRERLASTPVFIQEAERARAQLV
ncbi:aminotransferase class I and II [Stigmatella sp. ncwal1]|uniref:Aminotransferase class I and II n=1 Tax=Stigmatella ashevillensis TaxID=2995309 RepID=A0ABT5DE07_9BACT|nr:HipA family kinase [Stigmatella ashevillena]MDC0711343.1 aminotransferase class I and II [Stigmatella ashevillena]